MQFMEEKENDTNRSEGVVSRNDSFAQVIGKDKNDRVLMYGCGVCPSNVYNDILSCTTNQSNVIDALQQKLKKLTFELQELKSQGVQMLMPQIKDTQASDDLGPILQVASRHDWSLYMDDFSASPPQIGVEVCLKSIIKPRETVATGVLYSTDPSNEVNDEELGCDYWEVYVQVVMKPDERLVRSLGQLKTMGQVAGYNIAWPKSFVFSKENDAQFPSELLSNFSG